MYGITSYGRPGQTTHRYYKCHGKDTVARDRACRCTQTPAKVEELDAAVWGHVKALLEDPATLAARFEELAGLSEAKDDGRAAVQRWEVQLQRLGREEQRLVDAYQAEVIDLAELKARREQIQGRRHVLITQRDQEQRSAGRASGGEGGLVGPRGVLPAGAVPARRGDPRGAAADLAVADRAGHSRGGLAGDPACHPAGPRGRGAVRPRPGGAAGAG